MARKNEWQKGLKAGVKKWLTFNTEHNPTIWTEEIKKKLTSGELSYENYGDYFFNRSEKYIHTDVVREGLVCWLDGRDGSNAERTSLWRDRSGNGNNIILNGFKYDNTSGWVGNGIKFNGIDNDADGLIDTVRDNITLECAYIKIKDSSHMSSFVMIGESINETSPKYRIGTGYSDGKAHYVRNSLSVKSIRDVDADLGIKHISITYSKQFGITKLYLNGIFIKDFTEIDYGGVMVIDNLIFGRWLLPEKQFANCTIYSAKIYNRALSQEEVLQNYNYEKSIQRG